MPRGGRRAGAGRKSNAEIIAIRSILDRVITPDRREHLSQTIFDHANKGNVRAAEILIHYRYGDANAPVPSPDAEEPIRLVRIVVPPDMEYDRAQTEREQAQEVSPGAT